MNLYSGKKTIVAPYVRLCVSFFQSIGDLFLRYENWVCCSCSDDILFMLSDLNCKQATDLHDSVDLPTRMACV